MKQLKHKAGQESTLSEKHQGSCWGVSAAAAGSERLCIATGKPEHFLSARDLISCCTNCGYGCQGGWPSSAWSYMAQTGLPSGSPDNNDTSLCQRYPFLACMHHTEGQPQCSDYDFSTPKCVSSCDIDSTYPIPLNKDRTKAKHAYSIRGEENLMKELYENGPITVSYTVYEDFMAYKSGVYKHTSGKQLGGHAVTLEGWGVDEATGTKYWVVKNQWGKYWGTGIESAPDAGYFKIVRGTNDCGIEGSGNTGTY